MRRETTGCGRPCGALALLLVLWCLPLTAQAQSDAYAAFEDGNRLFRENLYWAALLRYRQAADAGLDTPLLHFNTGVAHYKAGQHIRARQSLQKATRSSSLRQLAHYNLGLNAWKLGETCLNACGNRRSRPTQRLHWWVSSLPC